MTALIRSLRAIPVRGIGIWIAAALAAGAGAADEAAGLPPPRTVADEVAVLESGRMRARQNALARLAAHADPAADGVLIGQFKRYRAGELPAALWLDLFEAAAKRENPELKAMLAEREREIAAGKGPLARFRECLEGGDADSGRAIFMTKPEAGCIRCHALDGEGGRIGPELTWLRHSVERVQLLEAVVVPNSTIATGHQSALLKLKSGEEISGVISFESPVDISITSVADGRKRDLKVADIAERTPLPSPMPPHFGAVLSKRELRDLIEFLAEGD